MTTRTTTSAATDFDDTDMPTAHQARQAPVQGDARAATRLRLASAAARFRRAANPEPIREE
ncbi:hypothetical protein [Streptomyces sp. BPTC-684]|uniref:hypothetical protein n=1 Tax=Streptomyces sp. BPTC-684 TaxID=3043734 RepID=UPI0024B083E7|nr:hypothetical protein [Streptomyces sp. BPTC-684]WHM41147.1 hypothetical protein QIY60_32670 [Streptomyces sp. BPTC-684]